MYIWDFSFSTFVSLCIPLRNNLRKRCKLQGGQTRAIKCKTPACREPAYCVPWKTSKKGRKCDHVCQFFAYVVFTKRREDNGVLHHAAAARRADEADKRQCNGVKYIISWGVNNYTNYIYAGKYNNLTIRENIHFRVMTIFMNIAI